MPSRRFILLGAALIAASFGAVRGGVAAQAATSAAPAVSTSGNRLVDAGGHPLRLLGVDRSGTEYACIQGWGIFDGPSDAASVQAIASWHVNAVRVPLNEDCWLGINGVPSQYGGGNYQAAVAAYVALLHEYGIVAILDLHWSAPGSTQATGQLPMPDSDHSVTFWSQVAAAYAGDPSTVFDLFNEPYPDDNRDSSAAWGCIRDGGSACSGLLIGQNGTSLSYQAAGMQTLVNAVRATGATNVLMISGPQYTNALDQWLQYEPSDPQHHLAASWHSYNFNACITSSCWNTQIAPLAAQAPVITGEIGENDCGDTYINALMPWLDAQGISYLGWTWDTWGCPGSLISSYSGTPNAFGQGLHDHLAALATAAAATTGGVVMTGCGDVHGFGSLAALSTPVAWPGWLIARDAALVPGSTRGYVLDGFGGIHPFGGATAVAPGGYWPGWDIARAIALRADGASGYVLDGFGGLHPFGGAPALAVSGYWPGWDVARDLVLLPSGAGGYVLDGFGGLHPFGSAPPLATTGYWPGWDIAHRLTLNSTGTGGYVLDGFGGIHPFGAAAPLAVSGYWPGWDIARDVTLTDAGGGYVLDGFGGVHPFGDAPAAGVSGYWPGEDIARALG